MIDDELRSILDTIRQDSAAMRQEIATIRQDSAEMRQDSAEMRREIGTIRQDSAAMRQEIDTIRQDSAAMRQEIGTVRQDSAEMRQEIAAIRQENAAAHTETRRLFNETADRIATDTRHEFEIATEAMRHEIRLIAESVTGVDERLTREAGDIREEMRRGFSETQALIKFSHDELDSRIRALEQRESTIE
jgi:uncharacterized protein (DUF3084 family)